MYFFGFIRAGELVIPSDSGFDPSYHLPAGNVLVDCQTSSSYIVNMKASETDSFRQGIQIHLGRTYSKLCPVAVILTYTVKGGTNDGPFFRFEDGRHVKRDRFVTTVNTALVTLGINPSHYAGHSFRITKAANCGLLNYLIKILG